MDLLEYIKQARLQDLFCEPANWNEKYRKDIIMDVIEKIDFLSDALLASTHISTFYFRTDLSLVRSNSAWENQLCNLFRFNADALMQISELKTSNMPILLIDSLYLNWLIQPCRLNDTDIYLVLGPVFETSISHATFRRQMDIQKMTVSSQIHFLKMVNDIPVLSNQQLFHYGAMFHYALFYHTITYSDLTLKGVPQSNTAAFPNMDKFDIPPSHGSQMFEKMMLRNVREGNINYMHPSSNILPIQNQTVGILCPGDPLRQAKDSIIVYITLVTRAAVEGGLSMETAYSLSDYYIQTLEMADSVNSVYELSQDMYDTFIRAVHQIRHRTPYSQTVQYAVETIRKHIYDEINIDALAEELGYNTYYLTKLFKKETGMSMKEYILKEKTENAKILLETTNLDINEISDSLSFHSPSYFSTAFKKVTGYTPLEYRKHTKES